jgi:hypothetical protein
MLPRFNEIVASLNLKSEVYISNVQQWVRPDVKLHKSETFYLVFSSIHSIPQFGVKTIQNAFFASWYDMFSSIMFHCQLKYCDGIINL